MTNNKSLALFDFDGTLTHGDTFIKFIRFTNSPIRYWMGILFLSPMLVLYKLGIIRNDKAKQIMFSFYFKNKSYENFIQSGKDFCKDLLPKLIKTEGMEKIKWHQSQQHRVILVSASIKEWVAPWCEKINIEYATTEVEIIDQKITGRFSTQNCYGIEKVNRIKSMLNLAEYSTIYAYGDTKGDKEMLSIAQHPHFKPFNK